MSAPPQPISAEEKAFLQSVRGDETAAPNPLVPATLRGPGSGMSDEAYLNMYRESEQRGGGPTDDDIAKAFLNQKSLVGGEPLPVGSRFWLGLLSDRFDEMEATVERYVPDVELMAIPDTDIVVFRNRTKEGGTPEEWRKVDKGFIEGLANKGAFLNEMPSDVAELVGEYGIVATTEWAGAKGAKKFLSSILRMGGGAGVGEGIRQSIQTIAHTQRQTLSEQAGEAGGEAVASMFGGTLGHGLGRVADMAAHKRGLFAATEEGRLAMAAAEELRHAGVPVRDPIPIQVVENPGIKKVGRQAAGILSGIPRALRQVDEALAQGIKSLSDPTRAARLREHSAAMVDKTSDDLINGIIAALRFKRTSLGRAARQMKQVAEAWWYKTGEAVSGLYAHARSIDEPNFDLEPAMDVARSIMEGRRAVGRPEMRPTGVLDASGEPIMEEVQELVQVRNLSPKLVSEIKKLLSLEPNMPRGEGASPAMDVLQELRANLSDLALPGPEGMRQENMIAKTLRDAISDVMANPTNASPEFQAAWKRASNAAHKRFTTRERAAVVELFGTENFTQFAGTLARPYSADLLTDLARAGGKEAIDPIRHAFWTQLVNDPWNITKRLDSFDKETLGILLHPSEQRVVRAAARQFDDITQAGLRDAIQNQTRVRPFVRQLVKRKDSAGIDALARVVERSGGKSGELGEALRAAIIDEVWAASHTIRSGRRTLSGNKLNATLDTFEDMGVLQFLSNQEVSILKNAELMTRVSESAADAGTSLEAASVVAGLRARRMSAFVILLENVGIGRLMTSEAGRKLIVGMGKDAVPFDLNPFRLMGGVVAGIAKAEGNDKTDAAIVRLGAAIPIDREPYRELDPLGAQRGGSTF